MEKIKVSLLVPIYNTSEYIEKCARSLFGQTYINIEYLFVNDCATDDSLAKLEAVLRQYPDRKNQVKVISHKENQGLAISRNTAVQAATGEYLFHVDSDDYIPLNAVALMVNDAVASDADIVYGICKGVREQKIYNFPQKQTDNVSDYLQNVLTRRCMVNIWGKLIRRSLYSSELLLKKEDSFGEDYLTLPKLIVKSNKIHFLQDTIYFYRLNRVGSYSECFNQEKIIRIKKCEKELKDWFQTQGYYNKKVELGFLLGAYYNKAGIIENANMSEYAFIKNIYPQRILLKFLPLITLKHFVVLVLFDLHLWILLKMLLKLKKAI